MPSPEQDGIFFGNTAAKIPFAQVPLGHEDEEEEETMMTAPVIGLTTYGRKDVDFRTAHYSEWFAIPTLYVDAVRRAGGVPLLIPPGDENLDVIINAVDAIILIGGGDINPELYGGDSAHPEVKRVDPERDKSEIALARRLALEYKRPTLCICRGLQVANVALGGTLYEHVPDAVGHDIHRADDTGWTVQALQVEAGSAVAGIMGAEEVATFSGHHQGIKDLGQGLQVTGTAADGMIEAAELRDHPWFICVQWHPEITAADDPTQQRLFDALVAKAVKNSLI